MRMAQMSGTWQEGNGAAEGQGTRRWPQSSLLGELQGNRSKGEIPQLPRMKDSTVTTRGDPDYFESWFVFTFNLTYAQKAALIIPLRPSTSKNPAEFGCN